MSDLCEPTDSANTYGPRVHMVVWGCLRVYVIYALRVTTWAHYYLSEAATRMHSGAKRYGWTVRFMRHDLVTSSADICASWHARHIHDSRGQILM